MALTVTLTTELLKEIYQDLAKPGVENVGKAIGSIVGLGNTILLPLHLLNERAKIIAVRNLETFRARLEREKAENIIEPAPEIAVPILERLTYTSDSSIAELYVALLSSASRANFKGSVHPIFVKIIESLTPDEGLILKSLATKHVIGYETLRAGPTSKGGFDRRSRVTAFPKDLNLTFPDKATLYCENLEALGILEDKQFPLKLDVHYEDVKKVTDPVLKQWKKEQPSVIFSKKRGSYHLSLLGTELVIACGHDDPKTVASLRRFWT